MIKIVGVRFRNAGKVYYFDPKEFTLSVGEHVIVETSKGPEFGVISTGCKMVADDQVAQPLRSPSCSCYFVRHRNIIDGRRVFLKTAGHKLETTFLSNPQKLHHAEYSRKPGQNVFHIRYRHCANPIHHQDQKD